MDTKNNALFLRPIKKILKVVLITSIWLAVWQLSSFIIDEELFIASPAKVLFTIIKLAQNIDFWIAIWNSLYRILTGFCLAVVTGLVISSIAAYKRFIYDALNPLFSIIKATPVASFTILALLWLKSEQLSVFIAFLMAVPIVYYNVYAGIKQTDPKLLEMAEVFRIPLLKKISRIYMPSTLPYLLSAASSALGLAWKAGIAAEVISIARNTIGNNIYQAKNYLETAEVFAWTAVIVLLSFLMEHLFIGIIKLAGREK